MNQNIQALELFKQALVIAKEENNTLQEKLQPKSEINIFSDIDQVYLGLNQYPQAMMDFFQEVLTDYRTIGDRQGEQNTLTQIREFYLSSGQPLPAQEFFKQILKFYNSIGDDEGEAHSLNQIGKVYSELQQYDQALDWHRQASVIYQQIVNSPAGDSKTWRTVEAETLGYIGNSYFQLGQYNQVEDLFRQKLNSLRKIGDRDREKILLKIMRRYLKEEWELKASVGTAKELFTRLKQGEISWQEQL
ncbi:MAG: tetratricopeptide repeat protein [Symploca sp. SIO2E6]|nr:tetratricopeptide repeat protein [Symploca sp. SIO2E6]